MSKENFQLIGSPNRALLAATLGFFFSAMSISLFGPTAKAGICQDTSKKLVRSLFIPEEPQQGLCPYASLPQDIFLT